MFNKPKPYQPILLRQQADLHEETYGSLTRHAICEDNLKPHTVVNIGVGFAMADVLIRPNIGSAAGFFTCEPSCDELCSCLPQNRHARSMQRNITFSNALHRNAAQ